MGPPLAPSIGVFAEGRASDGLQRGVNQVLGPRVDGIVIQEIEKLGNCRQPLFARQQTGPRKAARRPFPNLRGGVMRQDGEKQIDGFFCSQHSQTFDGPEAGLLIGVTRVMEKCRKHGARLDTAIAESPKSPERQEAAIGAAMDLMQESGKALRRLLEMVGSKVYFHGGGAHARIVCFQGSEH